MFESSNELLDYALQKLQVAVESNQKEVNIVLDEYFKGEKKEIKKFANQLDIKTITQMLREKFSDYDVKSIVGTESKFNAIITYKTAPCDIFHCLVWILTLQKKVS